MLINADLYYRILKLKKKKKQLSIDEELTFEESILLVVQK